MTISLTDWGINMILKLKYYSDAAHGWVAVKKKTLKDLNIADKITLYSYMKGETAYLEEDCDFAILTDALRANNVHYIVEAKLQSRGQSPIRYYQRYMAL